MDPDRMVTEIRRATEEVFTTMLGMTVQSGRATTEESPPGPTNGVVSLIGLTGQWVGTGSITCSAQTACRLSSRFLLTDFQSVNEEVLDAVAEITNMIIGGFKTSIEEENGPMGLSIPTVIFGHNFTARTLGKSNWTLVPFTCGEDRFNVHICLSPNDRHPAPPPGHGHSALQPAFELPPAAKPPLYPARRDCG